MNVIPNLPSLYYFGDKPIKIKTDGRKYRNECIHVFLQDRESTQFRIDANETENKEGQVHALLGDNNAKAKHNQPLYSPLTTPLSS